MLKQHIEDVHAADISACVVTSFEKKTPADHRLWDVYNEAIAEQERDAFPVVGCSVDRRAFEYTQKVFNDTSIRSLICCVCARILLDTGGIRSHIDFFSGNWFFKLPKGSLKKNFSMEVFTERYRQTGSPLAYTGQAHRNADFADWQLWLHPTAVRDFKMLEELQNTALLCCPEDHRCDKGCVEKKLLCASCELPVCKHCMYKLQANEIVEIGLCNDNWYGYVDSWIYENQVTWMEKTCALHFGPA